MQQRTLWVTGATGFVGSHFVHHVLRHSEARVVALVRGTRDQGASAVRDRLLGALHEAAASYREPLHEASFAERLTVVEGDITLPGCGVDLTGLPVSVRTGQHTFWHIAASLRFENKHRDEIRLLNVDGTHNALLLAQQLHVSRFVYVSTAYSCGRMQGEVPERLHSLERAFSNVYERTKCEAEHVVAAWSARNQREARILRPSIVVGPRRTHLPGGSDTGLYGFTREIYRLKRMLQASGTALTMLGDPEAGINLVPVDDVVEQMWQLGNEQGPACAVHHVTADSQPCVTDLFQCVARHCEILPIEALPARSSEASPVEQAVDRRAVFYSSYLRDPKRFARAEGAPIQVGAEDLDHYVREFLRERRQETADTAMSRKVVLASDRSALATFVAGERARPTIVFCNAIGVASDVWVPLVNALKATHHVLCWEPREAVRDQPAPGPQEAVRDLEQVLDAHDVRAAYLVGWCTGADVAALFAEQHPERALGVVAISGALNQAASQRTLFQTSLRKLVTRAALDVTQAALYHGLLFGHRRGDYSSLSASQSDESTLSSLVHSLDPSLLHLTSAPFRDANALHAYARAMCAYYTHCERRALPALSLPTLVVSGAQDSVAHPATSRAAARRWTGSRLLELAHGDHFSLFHDRLFASYVAEFIAGVEQSQRACRVNAA